MTTTFNHHDLQDNLYVLSIHGKLDAEGGLSIRDKIEAHVGENPGTCIIDMSDVEYMSSYGLRVLLVVGKKLDEVEGKLHLAEPNQPVMDVLTTSGYDSMFPIHKTLDDAKRELGA